MTFKQMCETFYAMLLRKYKMRPFGQNVIVRTYEGKIQMQL